MESAVPIQKDIVLIGGGHSHVAVLRSFGMKPIPGVRLTLISTAYDTPYSGMLPGHLAGHYTFDESHINLIPLCQFAQAQLYQDTVVGIDLTKKQIHCQDHPPVGFDFVSIDTGSTPRIDDIPGAKAHAIPVKPVDRFLNRWNEIEAKLQGNPKTTKRIIVVGGGAGGVELTLSLQHRLLKSKLAKGNPTSIKFSLITASPSVLSTHNQRVQKNYTQVLKDRGVEVATDFRVSEVEENQIIGTKGNKFPYDYLLWVTNASAPEWPKEAGLDVDRHGFISVDDYLQSTSHPFVFAAGDIATMKNYSRPKSGVFAVRQGPPLTKNLRQSLTGKALVRYHPQKHFLSLISTGDQFAIASKGKGIVKGKWVWRWKDQIDRRFMKRYQVLPEMNSGTRSDQSAPLTGNDSDDSYEKIRCMGCGSKVGAGILSKVLNRLKIEQDPSISIGLKAPDDAAVFTVPAGSPIVQTVDYFPAFIDDPWVFAQIAAIHCLGDVIAMGATPHSAQIIATLPYGHDHPIDETLFQTMSGALKVLDDHGTSLIGGHTLEGERLAFGMTINGTINDQPLLRKAGLSLGDRLVLTKPIGTGIILASMMRGKPASQWIQGAIKQMLRSNASAIPVLRKHAVTSATDLTGFGLVGHLAEMLDASNVNAELWIEKIPLLEGALECSRQGITSSLYSQNHKRSDMLLNREAYQENSTYPPLFDPQTSGGLLFGVSKEQTHACLADLKETGWLQATVIGTVTSKADTGSTITLAD
jgi:selenide, water dikinase